MEVGKKKMYYGVGSACGVRPNLGSALAPNILLKKRLDFEAPVATTLGEPSSESRGRVRNTLLRTRPCDSQWFAGLKTTLVPIARRTTDQKRRVINDCLDRGYSPFRSLRYDVDIWGLQGWTIYDSETWIAAFSVESRVFERDYHRPS